jgi:hypothetical protein
MPTEVVILFAALAASFGTLAVIAVGARCTRNLQALGWGGACSGAALGALAYICLGWFAHGFEPLHVWVLPLAGLVLLLVMVAQNWFVFYEDREDRLQSARPTLVMLAAAAALALAAHLGPWRAATQSMIWAGAISAVLVLSIHPLNRSIAANGSAPIGILVGRAAPAAATPSDLPSVAPRALRTTSSPTSPRKIPYYEVLARVGRPGRLLEHNADTILRGDRHRFSRRPGGAAIWKAAGADVQGERVHFARGMCRELVQRTAPREFTQHARNPARSVLIGGKNTVFAPGLRLAVRAQSRRRPPLRAHRGFPQFRQARVHGELAASLGRHDLRARRSAGQQAPSRHGLQPSQVQRQALHGFGDAPERAAIRSRWRTSCSAPNSTIRRPAARRPRSST